MAQNVIPSADCIDHRCLDVYMASARVCDDVCLNQYFIGRSTSVPPVERLPDLSNAAWYHNFRRSLQRELVLSLCLQRWLETIVMAPVGGAAYLQSGW